MLNLIPIAFATFMAAIDALVLSLFKSYSIGTLTWRSVLPLGMLVYSIQPLIFLQSLQYESMTVMNILWDVISDIIVTVTGLFYFKEKLSSMKMVGLAFAFTAIVLLSYDSMYNDKA
jgi:multidrug transporter EmrE-like cation transporter